MSSCAQCLLRYVEGFSVTDAEQAKPTMVHRRLHLLRWHAELDTDNSKQTLLHTLNFGGAVCDMETPGVDNGPCMCSQV